MKKIFILPPFKYTDAVNEMIVKYPNLVTCPPETFIDNFMFGRQFSIDDDSGFLDTLENCFNDSDIFPLKPPSTEKDIIDGIPYLYGKNINEYLTIYPSITALGRYVWHDAVNNQDHLKVTINVDEDHELFEFDQKHPLGIEYA